MAKGNLAKQEITKKILEVFDGAFTCDGGKEIRIPFTEEGNDIQIKITLTCAKVNVEPENMAGAAPSSVSLNAIPQGNFEITPEEKQATLDIIERLNL